MKNNCGDEGEQQMIQIGERESDVVENTIYFYGEVNTDNILRFNKVLRSINSQNLISKINRRLSNLDPIYLHLNSPGGSVFDGLSAMDNIMNSPSDVITVIDGFCASAATFMSVVGKKRLMFKHSYIMIHQLSVDPGFGTFSNLTDEYENSIKLMNTLKDIYLKHTKITQPDLDQLFKRDICLDSNESLALGFVDEIL
jgi:ATP-dependent Clp protease, protease subunit